jgi:hypothetical protein
MELTIAVIPSSLHLPDIGFDFRHELNYKLEARIRVSLPSGILVHGSFATMSGSYVGLGLPQYEPSGYQRFSRFLLTS